MAEQREDALFSQRRLTKGGRIILSTEINPSDCKSSSSFSVFCTRFVTRPMPFNSTTKNSGSRNRRSSKPNGEINRPKRFAMEIGQRAPLSVDSVFCHFLH